MFLIAADPEIDKLTERRTFPPHAHLETLLESTVLALVAVVLVNRAASVAPTCVRQIPPH